MNVKRLQMMVNMLREVAARQWKATASPELFFSSDLFPERLLDVPVGSHKFDLTRWFESKGNPLDMTCGYSACAVGHACVDKRFTDMGLKLVGRRPAYRDPEGDPNDDDSLHSNWTAVEKFFDLTNYQAEFLFHNDSYQTGNKTGPTLVANRIEQLIADDGSIPL